MDIHVKRERSARAGEEGAASILEKTAHRTLVVAPFYKAERLVDPLVSSLIASAGDLAAIDAELLMINDSPDYAPLAAALDAACARALSVAS